MEIKTLIVPGYTNSGPFHWQTLWESRHPAYVRVNQKDWDRPDVGDWTKQLNTHIQDSDKPVLLIAHSLGCINVAHWSAKYKGRILGAFLVAPPDVESPVCPAEIRGFAPVPMAELPFPSLVIASANDPYCTVKRAESFAYAWKSSFFNVGKKGHINTSSDLGVWEEGEALLNGFLTSLTTAPA
jgi:uncharacterized protein